MKNGLKIILCLTLLLSCLTAIANAGSLDLPQNKQNKIQDHKTTRISIILEETKEVEPDKLQFRIDITVRDTKEGDVINILGSIDREIRSLNFDYEGGNYHIYKNCFWEKNRWRCFGFVGNLHYVFNLKNLKEQSQILEVLEAHKEKQNQMLEYQVSGPSWTVSEKQHREVEKNLKLNILQSAVEFGKKFGLKLNRKCSVVEVDYEVKTVPVIKPLRKEMELLQAVSQIEAPEPKKDKKTILVRAKVSYICIEE